MRPPLDHKSCPQLSPIAWRGALAIALIAGLLWGAQFALTFRGIDTGDAYNYAQVARNVARGQGLVTQEAVPYDFTIFRDVPHPEIMHPPLQAISISLLFRLLGEAEWVASLPAAISYILTAALIYLAALRLAGVLAGLLAATLFLCHPASANYAGTGLAESLYGLLLTASVLLVAGNRAQTRWPVMLLVGATLGLTELTRETMRYLLPLVGILLWGPREGRAARLLGVILGFGVITLPNLMRLWVATGSPLGAYGQSILMIDMPPFRDLGWYRSMSPFDPVAYVSEYPLLLERKIANNLDVLVRIYQRAVSPVLLLGALISWRLACSPVVRRSARIMGVALALQISVSAVFRLDLRHFVPFVPLLACLTGIAVATLRRRFGHVALLLALVAVGWTLWETGSVRVRQFHVPSAGFERRRAAERALGEFVAERTAPGDLVVTDISEVIAWRSDRRTVWFPLTEALLERIPRRQEEEHYLLLTSIGLETRPDGWIGYLRGPAEPVAFGLVDSFSEHGVVARLFRRRSAAALPDSVLHPRQP